MAEQNQADATPNEADSGLNWGSWLFYGTLVVILIFFWWLLIDSGGVSGHHG
jgi:hypothetical protein